MDLVSCNRQNVETNPSVEFSFRQNVASPPGRWHHLQSHRVGGVDEEAEACAITSIKSIVIRSEPKALRTSATPITIDVGEGVIEVGAAAVVVTGAKANTKAAAASAVAAPAVESQAVVAVAVEDGSAPPLLYTSLAEVFVVGLKSFS